ncbi:GNAT family N-acetyltransferase [Flavobacterium pedocola]
MTISSLSNIPLAILADTFNQAFSDYLVPMCLTEDDLKTKFHTENISLEHSVGAFDKDRLVGFMFIGSETNTETTIFYNGGTGVIPSHRGQQLTEKMYTYLLKQPITNKHSVHLLEVITENLKAVNIYEKAGFKTKRLVTCFKGMVNPPKNIAPLDFKPITFEDTLVFKRDWAFQPSYQNSSEAIKRTLTSHQFFGAFDNDILIGYLSFMPASGRIKQFFIKPDYRNKGVGHHLFHKAQEINKEALVSLTNIDNTETASLSFLNKIGLQQTVQQFEMVLEKT